jgi:hypothetical protein
MRIPENAQLLVVSTMSRVGCGCSSNRSTGSSLASEIDVIIAFDAQLGRVAQGIEFLWRKKRR